LSGGGIKKILKAGKNAMDATVFRLLPDSVYLKLCYRIFIHRKLNLKAPEGYNAKLQWLKLHDRNPRYSVLADKFAAKQEAGKLIGREHVAGLLGGPWYHPDEIDINSLPQQFVLKVSHDCGSVFVCEDKSKFQWDEVRRKLKKSLKRNYFYKGREWPYKNIRPCIFAEQYLGSNLTDYKFLCFDGEAKMMFTVSDRSSEMKVDFFDMDFQHLKIRRHYPISEDPVSIDKPEQFEEMKKLAEKLSAGIPHVRIDFYICDGQVYFGEWTFYPGSGLEEFQNFEDDIWIGKFISIV